jgi:phosphoglucomutase
VKANWMIMDAIKDHLIPHISENKTTKEMFDALVSLYQSENLNMKMILRNKLRSIEMTIPDSVTTHIIKVMQIFDKLATIREKVANVELENMALNGFPASWEPLVKGICAHENLPIFERLWDDCI